MCFLNHVELQQAALRCLVLALICLALTLQSGFSATFPTSQTVMAYEIAFFPCEDSVQSQPLWLINSTEYSSISLIPNHATNASGLLVYALPEYNNTIYQCRFLYINFKLPAFIDIDSKTSPQALLTITESLTEEPECLCERNSPTRATYNYTSQLLTVGLNNSLTEDSSIGMSACMNGTVEKYLNQNCSAVDVELSPQVFSNLIVFAFPPICNACIPVLDYTIYMGIDFAINATIPSSVLQVLQVLGTCLESRLFLVGQFQCSNPQIYISGNGKSRFVSFTNEEYFLLEYVDETLRICVIDTGPIRDAFGDVKEVFMQEVCVINSNDLCSDPQSVVDASYVHIFGSKGMLPVDSNATDVQEENVCSLIDLTTSSTASITSSLSPSETLTSISSSILIAPVSSSAQLTLTSIPETTMSSSRLPVQSSSSPSPPVPVLIIVAAVLGALIVFVIAVAVLILVIHVFRRYCGGDSYICNAEDVKPSIYNSEREDVDVDL